MFLSKGHRDLRFAFQTHPGSQASCRRVKKIRDTKGTFQAKMGSIKDRNGMDPNFEDSPLILNEVQSLERGLYRQGLKPGLR